MIGLNKRPTSHFTGFASLPDELGVKLLLRASIAAQGNKTDQLSGRKIVALVCLIDASRQ